MQHIELLGIFWVEHSSLPLSVGFVQTVQSMEETESLVRMAMRGPDIAGHSAGILRFDDPVHNFAADLGILDDSDLLSSFISDDFQVPGLGGLLHRTGEDPEFTSADFKSM